MDLLSCNSILISSSKYEKDYGIRIEMLCISETVTEALFQEKNILDKYARAG